MRFLTAGINLRNALAFLSSLVSRRRDLVSEPLAAGNALREKYVSILSRPAGRPVRDHRFLRIPPHTTITPLIPVATVNSWLTRVGDFVTRWIHSNADKSWILSFARARYDSFGVLFFIRSNSYIDILLTLTSK